MAVDAVVVTAAESELLQARVAGTLARRGLRPGDRLGLCLSTTASLLHVIGGSLRSGIVPVVANAQLLPAERDAIRADADVADWIDDQARLEELFDGPLGELASVPLSRPMHYTSGTTGRPKGVWTGVLAEDLATRLWEEEIEQWQFDAADRHLVCSPLQHSAPIRFALSTLLVGGTVLMPGTFEAGSFAAAVGMLHPTTTFCSPAHLQRLQGAGKLGAFASMRLVAHAGAPCPDALKRAAIDEIGVDRLWEFYGSTEGQFTVCSSAEWLDRPGTVGRARSGRLIEVGTDGVVWCEAPPWARWTYWRDEERTAQAWRAGASDGSMAFTVGDLGRLDDGYLFLTGRRNDLIISGGVNVYPAEVELVLREIAGVEDVAVFGRPDERWGQRVCAAVVGAVDPDDVQRYAAAHLAAYKRPKEVHVVEAIPRVGLAKVRRSRLAIDLGLETEPVDAGLVSNEVGE